MGEREYRDVGDRDDVHSVLWTSYDRQQIDTRSLPNVAVIFARLLILAGASPSGKAVVFGTTMRRFESFRPNSS